MSYTKMKSKPIKLLFLLCVYCMLFTSCIPYFYRPKLYQPNTLNMPLAGDKGEIKANVNYGYGGLGLQGSYAADSSFLVFANASYQYYSGFEGIWQVDSGTPPNKINCFIGDIGAGYYSRLNNALRFEVLGGIGYGSTNSRITGSGDLIAPSTSALSAKYYRLFVQSDIGWANKNFEAGFGLRLTGMLKYGTYTVTNIFFRSDSAIFRQNINGAAVFAEPCINIGIGFENVKLNATAGYSYKIMGENINREFSNIYQPAFLTVGITVNLFRKLN